MNFEPGQKVYVVSYGHNLKAVENVSPWGNNFSPPDKIFFNLLTCADYNLSENKIDRFTKPDVINRYPKEYLFISENGERFRFSVIDKIWLIINEDESRYIFNKIMETEKDTENAYMAFHLDPTSFELIEANIERITNKISLYKEWGKPEIVKPLENILEHIQKEFSEKYPEATLTLKK